MGLTYSPVTFFSLFSFFRHKKTPPPGLVLTRAVGETQVHHENGGGHNSSSTSSSESNTVRLDKQMAPLADFPPYHYIPVTTSTAPGHGHHHTHTHHPSVIHEGHSEGKITLSSDQSESTASASPSNGQMELDSNVDHQSVVISAQGVNLSTSGNNTSTTSCITQQVSNPEIKVEKESPMHTSEDTSKQQGNSNGKDTSSSVANCESLTDAIKSDCNDNGCQSSTATAESNSSNVNSSAVTPASS